MAAIGEVWVSWFSCCVTRPQQKRRHRIDRSMIGEPTNFIHTGHIGQRDVENSEEKLVVVWNQMRSKGGYSMSYQIPAVS